MSRGANLHRVGLPTLYPTYLGNGGHAHPHLWVSCSTSEGGLDGCDSPMGANPTFQPYAMPSGIGPLDIPDIQVESGMLKDVKFSRKNILRSSEGLKSPSRMAVEHGPAGVITQESAQNVMRNNGPGP